MEGVEDVIRAFITEIEQKPRRHYRLHRRRVKVNGKMYEYIEVRAGPGTRNKKPPIVARLKPGDPRLDMYECEMWRAYAYAYAHALLTALISMREVCTASSTSGG